MAPHPMLDKDKTDAELVTDRLERIDLTLGEIAHLLRIILKRLVE